MTVTVVDNDSARRHGRDGPGRVPGGAPLRERRQTSASAPRTTSRSGPRAATTCSRSTPTPGHPRRPGAPARPNRRAPGGGDRAAPARARGRHPRPCGEALLPDPAERARPLHRASAAAASPGRSPPTARPTSAEGPVDAVNGAFMLMRRRRSTRSGSSTRATGCTWRTSTSATASPRRAGSTWYEPAVTVVHMKAGTSGKHRSPRLNYAFHYGMLRFYRSHYAPQRSPLLNVAIYAGIAVKLAAALVRSALGRLGEAVTPARSEGGADPVDRRRVGAEEPAVPARAGPGRRGWCGRADAGP